MPPSRICQAPSCANSLEGYSPLAKTCGNVCKKRRERHIAANRRKAGRASGMPAHLADMSQVARDVAPDVLRDVLREEAVPVAREALTEDVLRSLQALIHLTPQAVANLASDLVNPDDRLRQKATELLLRYTLGNQSVAPTATNNPAPMQVMLTWPTAPAPTEVGPPTVDVTAEDVELASGAPETTPAAPAGETRECMECRETKSWDLFVGASERCQVCHDGALAKVRERFGEDAV